MATSETDPSSPEDPARRPLTSVRRSPSTRRAILEAALDLVTASGFESVTIEAIAREAGVGKQSIYRWWPSKGAVILEAFSEQLVAERNDLVANDDELDTGDIASDVRRLLRSTVHAFAVPSFEAPYRAMAVAVQNDAELSAQMLDQVLRPSMDVVKGLLASGRERNEIRADVDLDVAVELLIGPIFHRWFLRTAPLDDDYADALADAVMVALVPSRSA